MSFYSELCANIRSCNVYSVQEFYDKFLYDKQRWTAGIQEEL